MKKWLLTIGMLLVLGICFIYRHQIINTIVIRFVYPSQRIETMPSPYLQKNDFMFIQYSDSEIPENKQDILNIIYSSLSYGDDIISFVCPNSYRKCLDDVKSIIKDEDLLSSINNFIHPFHTYSQLNIEISSLGIVKMVVDKTYTQKEIDIVNQKIDQIMAKVVDETMTLREKIQAIHDYIIDHTVFDQKKSDDVMNGVPNDQYRSGTALGPLVHGYGICGGYTDTMALFLNRLNILNYRIASENHIWNYLKFDDNWYHLDLTWDDPLMSDGSNNRLNTYFLISTKEMEKFNTKEHLYPKTVYQEAS